MWVIRGVLTWELTSFSLEIRILNHSTLKCIEMIISLGFRRGKLAWRHFFAKSCLDNHHPTVYYLHLALAPLMEVYPRWEISPQSDPEHYGNSDFEIVNISSHHTEDLLYDSSECHTTTPQKIIFDVFSFCCYIQGGPKKKEQV